MKARWIAGLLAMLLLAGCGLPFAAGRTMQVAINEDVQRHGYDVLTEPEIKLVRPLPGAAVVLTTYEAIIDGEHVLVIEKTSMEQQELGWSARGSRSTWFPVAEPLPLFYAGGGASSGGNIPTHLEASGLVNDPAVQEVTVTLSDGSRTAVPTQSRVVVPVENGAFLFAQEGTMVVLGVEALNAQNTVIHRERFNQ